MTREQLEATAWQLTHRLTSPDPQERSDAMDDLLQAADAYACHTGGITAERRAVLAGTRP